MQCSARKRCVLTFMWMFFDPYKPSGHVCRPSIHLMASPSRDGSCLLLVFLKEHPHESQDPRLHSQEMMSVTHFICQCCFGSLVYMSFLVVQKDFFLSLAPDMIWTHDKFSLEMQSGGGNCAQLLYVCFSFKNYDYVISYFVCICVCVFV